MMVVVPFEKKHLTWLLSGGLCEGSLKGIIREEHGENMIKDGNVYTILENEIPVAIGGIVKHWENRGEAWLLLGNVNKSTFVSVFKKVKKFLDDSSFKRLEMIIEHSFKNGDRWARALGFHLEAFCLEGYHPSGSNVAMYSRIKR